MHANEILSKTIPQTLLSKQKRERDQYRHKTEVIIKDISVTPLCINVIPDLNEGTRKIQIKNRAAVKIIITKPAFLCFFIAKMPITIQNAENANSSSTHSQSGKCKTIAYLFDRIAGKQANMTNIIAKQKNAALIAISNFLIFIDICSSL